MGKVKFLKKGFRVYYVLVLSIILLTVAIQSIVQYSLEKQRSSALVVNLSGRQRMLSQRVLNEFNSCKFYNCDYAEMRLSFRRLYEMNKILQQGDEKLGIPEIKDEAILVNFEKLESHLTWMRSKLENFDNFENITFIDLRYRVNRFTTIMDGIVSQLQRKSERDIRTMMIIELELAVFSIFIILFEIFFIANPIIERIMEQKKKLKEIAWHQSHAFSSHMKNIKDLKYVLRAERQPERQAEIFKFIIEELESLEGVSKNMTEALKQSEGIGELPHQTFLRKVEDFLKDHRVISNAEKVTDGDRVHSVKS